MDVYWQENWDENDQPNDSTKEDERYQVKQSNPSSKLAHDLVCFGASFMKFFLWNVHKSESTLFVFLFADSIKRAEPRVLDRHKVRVNRSRDMVDLIWLLWPIWLEHIGSSAHVYSWWSDWVKLVLVSQKLCVFVKLLLLDTEHEVFNVRIGIIWLCICFDKKFSKIVLGKVIHVFDFRFFIDTLVLIFQFVLSFIFLLFLVL